MLRTIYGDPDRYVSSTGRRFRRSTSPETGARKDKDGYFWIMGRVDDVINVSGHRLSTMEVESALVAHEAVAEAAAVGRPDDLKVQAIFGLRHSPARPRADSGVERGTAALGSEGNRCPGQARRHPLHRHAAEDSQRKNHAPSPARTRHQRRRQRRHDHAGRFQCDFQTERERRGIRQRRTKN